MDREHAEDILGKSAQIVARQRDFVEKLNAEGADTTEAEHLLAYFATAHTTFEKCVARAIREQEEATIRTLNNLAHAG